MYLNGGPPAVDRPPCTDTLSLHAPVKLGPVTLRGIHTPDPDVKWTVLKTDQHLS